MLEVICAKALYYPGQQHPIGRSLLRDTGNHRPHPYTLQPFSYGS